jgi:hypothetical protein
MDTTAPASWSRACFHVPYLAERPPHFLDDLHVFERRVQRLGGGVYWIHHGLRSV